MPRLVPGLGVRGSRSRGEVGLLLQAWVPQGPLCRAAGLASISLFSRWQFYIWRQLCVTPGVTSLCGRSFFSYFSYRVVLLSGWSRLVLILEKFSGACGARGNDLAGLGLVGEAEAPENARAGGFQSVRLYNEGLRSPRAAVTCSRSEPRLGPGRRAPGPSQRPWATPVQSREDSSSQSKLQPHQVHIGCCSKAWPWDWNSITPSRTIISKKEDGERELRNP